MNKRGFTLIELVVALVLMGIVSGAIYQLLITNQRVYRQQTQRVDLNSNLRAAVAILPTELRELSANDGVESDLVAIAPDSVVYKAMRSMYVVCADAVGLNEVTVQAAPWYGVRAMNANIDYALVFHEGDPGTKTDNTWLHADFNGATSTTTCADGTTPAFRVPLTNIQKPPLLALVATPMNGVLSGVPFRSYERMKFKTYEDARGDYWVGIQRYSSSAGVWGSLEPLLGPVAPNGLQLAYFDSTGAQLDPATADRRRVARIRITVIGRTREAVRIGNTVGYLLDTLVAEVALRNSSRR